MANISYKLCPNCELNWIPEDQEICDICKQGYNGDNDMYDDIDEEDLMLCPICNLNYILETDKMCELCAAEKAPVDEEDEEYDYSEDVTITDDEEDIIVSFDEIEEEEEEYAKDEEIYDDIDDDDQDY